MLILLVDMAVLWLLLNMLSGQNWDDERLKVFLIALSITVVGGLATRALVETLGLFALGVYYAIGLLILKVVASLEWKNSAIVMAIFMVYQIVVGLVLAYMRSS